MARLFKRWFKATNNRVGLTANYWKVFAATTISSLGSGISGVALPWIASSLTRDPIAISLIALAGQLPWIIFTLPAGVLIDRLNKKRILIAMDAARGLITAVVALVIFLERDTLGSVTRVNKELFGTRWSLLSIIIVAQLAMGFATVLADTTSQAVLPSVASKEQLTHANGRIWAAISVSEQFVGPPIGSFLLGIAAFVPLLFDATSFFLSAGLILLVSVELGRKRESSENQTFKADIKEGFSWLWSHKIFRTLALTLGAINFLNSLFAGTYIFFAQEVLNVSVFQFAILGTGFAIGGVIGGTLGPRLAKHFGESRSLSISMLSMSALTLLTGLTSNWIVVWACGILTSILVMLWNIVTVSFRQSVIPEHLFGRVNSVYRFFGTGSGPIGAILGAGLVSMLLHFVDRTTALRAPFIVSSLVTLLVFALTRSSLSDKEFAAFKTQGKSR